MKIEFDTDREITVGEMLLLQKIGKGDWEAFVDFVLIRATAETRPTRADILLLPISEANKMAVDISEHIASLAKLSTMIKMMKLDS